MRSSGTRPPPTTLAELVAYAAVASRTRPHPGHPSESATSVVTSRMITRMSTTESEPPIDDRERRFLALVVYAVDFGATFDRLLIASGNNEPQARDDMPSALLFELAHLSRLQFDATCHDPTDGWLSHAAPTHLRPLLEGMGQIAFILGHETDHPVGSSQQRATCLGLARVREEHQAMSAADPNNVPFGTVEEGRKRVRIFEEMHERIGCPYPSDAREWPCHKDDGTPCDHRSAWPCRTEPAAPRKLTTPTMRRLSERMSFRFRDLEQASSLVLDMSLVDRLMVDTGRGTNAFAAASYGTRASTLAMALSAVGPSLVWVMDYFDAAGADALKSYMRSMWAKPDMQEISAGVWDRSASRGT